MNYLEDSSSEFLPVRERWAQFCISTGVLTFSVLLLASQRTYPTYLFWWISVGYVLSVVASVLFVLLLADDLKRSSSINYQPKFESSVMRFQNAGRAMRTCCFLTALGHVLVAAWDASR